ncbi:MAG: hypothetical protein AB2A00_02565 [Myxococcota bacterium]
MTTSTLSPPVPLTSRSLDFAAVLGGAAAGTAGIVLLFNEPTALLVFMLLLCGVLLLRWHTRADLLGLLVGLSFGNLTEVLCDATGVWVHATRAFLDVAPFYILVCYPILGFTVPHLMNALAGRARERGEGSARALRDALLLWGTHLGLSCLFGTRNAPEAVVCVVLLGLTLWRFHTVHDLWTAAFGAVLGLVWEIPATVSGAWHFPAPQLMGLIPAWLPLAYAVFFVNLGRITVSLQEILLGGRRADP